MRPSQVETVRTAWARTSPAFQGFVLFGTAISMCWTAIVSVGKLHPSTTLILPNPNKILFFELLIQDVTIFFLLGFWRPLPRMRRNVSDFAITASRQFVRFWFIAWVGFFLLYTLWCLLAFTDAYEVPLPPVISAAVHLAIDFANLLSAASFFLCYLVMTLKTVPVEEFDWYQHVFWTMAVCGLFILAEALTMIVFPDLQPAFSWVEGLLTGVSLALLVGRFESKLIDSPTWVLVALYVYAVIQLSWADLDPVRHQSIFLCMTSAALFLKALMFWYVGKLTSSGVLVYYMAGFREIYNSAPKDRAAFLDRIIVKADATNGTALHVEEGFPPRNEVS
jgi:hypothetical protein